MSSAAKDAQLAFSSGNQLPAALWSLALRLKHVFGVDRAIAFTVMARGVQILGSTGTVLLILRFLTPIEQGYYYTLLSLVSLQTVFELGFSFVILQMAAHECAHLTLHHDGRIEGDGSAHVRLASILQKTFRWYLLASVILCVSLLPLGAYFFSRHAHGSTAVAWHGPWTVAVLATAGVFFLNPLFSFLEGCGQVWQVGSMRFAQSILGAAMSWTALLAHRGLYSPGMVNLGYSSAGLAFLYTRRHLCFALLRFPSRQQAISWRHEVWPFQWKIAVSWVCSYFTVQICIPVLFAFRGPAEAGQFGMSLSITLSLSTLVLAWMSTKAAPFGQMIARGELPRSKTLFFHTLRQALIVLLAVAAGCELAVLAIQRPFPRLAARMVTPCIFGLLLLTCISWLLVQSMAIYLRSFKREPFLVQSVVMASATSLFVLLVARMWGVPGVALCYFACTGIVGLVFATAIFSKFAPTVAYPEAAINAQP
jgi:hypothetical protein